MRSILTAALLIAGYAGGPGRATIELGGMRFALVGDLLHVNDGPRLILPSSGPVTATDDGQGHVRLSVGASEFVFDSTTAMEPVRVAHGGARYELKARLYRVAGGTIREEPE